MKNLYKIELDQFKTDYNTCPWIQGLISLSKDFFQKTAVINGVLFLEGETHEDSLGCLNEASSVDFSYYILKHKTIEDYFDSCIIQTVHLTSLNIN